MPEGQAVVLDNPRDPMSLILMGQQQQAMQHHRQAQLGLQQQKADAAEVNKALAYKFEKPEDRFRQWGQDIINKANEEVFSVYRSNPNADALQLKQQISQIQGNRQKELDYGIETATLFDQKKKSLDGFKDILNKKEADRIMSQIISKDNPFDVDRDLLENIEQVPAIYDLNAIVADSVSGIKDQFRQVSTGEIQSSPLGLFMEIKENKMRFKDIEKTMDYLLRGDDVTDIGMQQKINGGMISDVIRYDIAKQETQKSGGDPNDVSQVMERFKEIQYNPRYADDVRRELKGILEQFNQEDRDVKVQTMGKFKQASMSEELKENRLKMRDQNLNAIRNPYASPSDDKPTKEAQAAVSRILGGDFGGGKVIEAEFDKGDLSVDPSYMKRLVSELNESYFNPTPENKRRVDETVKDMKNHLVQKSGNKVNMKVKTGTVFGEPVSIETLPLDLSDHSSEAILNALMNKNAGESNIPLDDVMFYRNKNSHGSSGMLYGGEEEDDDGFLDD